MVSARGRKKTQQGRKSQQGRSQKSPGRSSPAKQRKHKGQVKHQHVEKQKKRALKRPLHSINAKMQIKRDGRFLSRRAKGLMISFVEDIYQQVLSAAERLQRKSRDPLISPTHVQAALQHVVPRRRWRSMPTVVSKKSH